VSYRLFLIGEALDAIERNDTARWLDLAVAVGRMDGDPAFFTEEEKMENDQRSRERKRGSDKIVARKL